MVTLQLVLLLLVICGQLLHICSMVLSQLLKLCLQLVDLVTGIRSQRLDLILQILDSLIQRLNLLSQIGLFIHRILFGGFEGTLELGYFLLKLSYLSISLVQLVLHGT